MEKTLKNVLINSCKIVMKESCTDDDTLELKIEFTGEGFYRKVSYIVSKINLDSFDNWEVKDVGTSLISKLMKTVDVKDFSDITGKYCRVTLDDSENISCIYNIIYNDDYVDLTPYIYFEVSGK